MATAMNETQAHYETRCMLRTGHTRTRVRREMQAMFEADWRAATATFPCGCKVAIVERAVTIEPCWLDCFVLRLVNEASTENGNDKSVIADPEADPLIVDEAVRRFT